MIYELNGVSISRGEKNEVTNSVDLFLINYYFDLNVYKRIAR